MPAGVALMAKLAMALPVEIIVNPVAAVLTVRVSADADRVNSGAEKEKARTGRTLTTEVYLFV